MALAEALAAARVSVAVPAAMVRLAGSCGAGHHDRVVLFGEDLPVPIGPPAVAIIAASLALLVIYGVRIEPVDNVLRDIDWKTLVFLGCIFFLMQSVTKTGLLRNSSITLREWFGTEFTLAAMTLIAGSACCPASWRISRSLRRRS